MSNSPKVWLWLMLLLLAGCSTTPRRNTALVPDWKDPDVAQTTLAPPPAIAPPASTPPSPITQPPPAVPPISPPPVAVSPLTPAETWVPLARWLRSNGLGTVTRSSASAPTFALRNANGVLLFRTGSEVAQWDGVELHLGFAPQLIDGQPCLHALDLKTTVLPLLQGGPGLSLGASPVLVLDPGHGGENVGTRSVLGRYYEKDYTLDWALRLRTLLATNGWQVFLTRSNDTDLALSNRVAFAEQHKAALFLSLHFNSAAEDHGEVGVETYCLTPVGLPSSLTRGFAEETALAFPNNAFDFQNLQLALRVHRALIEVNGHHDRGVRHARFPGVLRNQQRPAVLIEGGYLSNPREARLIADPAYRQKLAEALARALLVETQAQGPKPKAQSQQTGGGSSKSEGPKPGDRTPQSGVLARNTHSP